MRLAEYAACTVQMQNFSGKLEDEANHSEYTGVKGRILLKITSIVSVLW